MYVRALIFSMFTIVQACVTRVLTHACHRVHIQIYTRLLSRFVFYMFTRTSRLGSGACAPRGFPLHVVAHTRGFALRVSSP